MSDDYRISTGSTAVAGTGWLNASLASTAIVGTNSTIFLTELHAGDILLVGGQIVGTVASIANNDHLTLTLGCPVVLSNNAFTYDPLVPITSLNADAVFPLGSYYRWALTLPTGDALERAMGRPRASWYWKNIGVGLRSALLTYCTSKSARVYMRTLVDPNLATFATYQAALLWPDTDYSYNQEFSLEFRDLVAL